MKVKARQRISIERSPQAVFDFVTSLEAPARTFPGKGKIPGVVKTEIEGDGAFEEGAILLVHGTDGSVMKRKILQVDRPHRHSYRLMSGFKPPFCYLVTAGEGIWEFNGDEASTDLVWTYEFRLTTAFVFLIAWLVIRLGFADAMKQCLTLTKSILEAAPSSVEA